MRYNPNKLQSYKLGTFFSRETSGIVIIDFRISLKKGFNVKGFKEAFKERVCYFHVIAVAKEPKQLPKSQKMPTKNQNFPFSLPKKPAF